MLILLPPSEGKTAPRRGKSLDLATLASPALTPTRTTLLDALTTLCRDDPDKAVEVLGLGPAQRDLVQRNATLGTAPTARADAIYTGVLYDALGFDTLSPAARRRATSRVAVTSSLFGIVRPGDRIPAYRLSGDAALPGVGSVAGAWREVLGDAITEAVRGGLLVDLRSSTYAAFWRPGKDLSRRVATVRVLHEAEGRRSVVSHFNKATKGRIVRALLEDGADPRSPKALAEALTRLGWTVEVGEPTPKGTQLDVVVTQV
ncbi:peroxide stress protein YaaA [Nocardioides eburneiflavus]|uniref:Peroxide stress protein YaaA n=1 Tax=Nocardioides eburneiflavus TaxID=2518372 RepID=A0A4Z1C4P0_9ACTN|nr:peroxide stress protein YaaA [Nocardioides eburneiflavus]TGN65264.1 peroxide stress protein YaaA [Nocardioides eburneiflavus]